MAKRQIQKIRPGANPAPTVSPQSIQVTQQSFHGPVPPPQILDHYEAILPGATERIFRMAEKAQDHRQSLESRATNANIDAQARNLSIAKDKSDNENWCNTLGLLSGFIAALACIAGAIYLGMNEHQGLAGALIGVPLIGLVKVFRDKPKDAPTKSN